MAATLSYEGRILALEDILNDSTYWRFVLFQSMAVVTAAAIYTDIVQATFSGYTVATPAFGVVTLDGANRASSVAPYMEFAHDGGGTANDVYGYALVDIDTTTLLFFEFFSGGPKTMQFLGDTIRLTPTLTLTQA